MADIQSAAAEIRPGKKEEERRRRRKTETTGQKYNGLPNVMAALPNIGGALCSTPQFG